LLFEPLVSTRPSWSCLGSRFCSSGAHMAFVSRLFRRAKDSRECDSGFWARRFVPTPRSSYHPMLTLLTQIVPDISSSLDDPREHAETLQADHRNMTKFWGREDPNYVKLG